LLMLVVVDTNILVSALWSKDGAPAKVISLILNEALIPCYDHRILSEYREVLKRPKFGFLKSEINSLLDWFKNIGRSIVAEPCNISFIDEADKKFYEVAKFCHAKLITGNLKHFPDDPDILSVAEFLEQYEKKI
jgi:putative PIN family toxin of toxin-antitoxin system